MNDNELLAKIINYQNDVKKYTIIYFAIGIAIPICIMKSIFEIIVQGNWILYLALALIFHVILKPINKKIVDAKNAKNNFIGDNIVRSAIGEMININQYNHTHHIDSDVINNSPIMPEYDKINGSDYIRGTYKNVNLEYSDVVLKKRDTYVDSDGKRRTTYDIKFMGHFLRLSLNSQIDGYVKLIEKNDFNKKGLLSNIVSNAKNFVGMGENSIKVESEAFNNQFDIFTNNDELAFYILTPHFMESVVEADRCADGATNIYFNKTYVDIAMDTRKDSFRLKGKINNQNDLDKAKLSVKKDLEKILSVVDQILEKDRLF